MGSIVGVGGRESTAVKRKMSDIHVERSETTNEETVDNLDIPSTEPRTTLIVSDINKNVQNKPDQETFMKKISLLQQRINVLTEARDAGIANDEVHEEIKN